MSYETVNNGEYTNSERNPEKITKNSASKTLKFRFYREIRFKDTQIGKIPEDWEITSVSKISRIVLGGTPKRSHNEYWNGPIKWASAKDVAQCKGKYLIKTEETITEKGLQESNTKLLPKGSLILTARGTVGELRVIGEKMAFNQSCYGLIPKKDMDGDFLYYTMKEGIKRMMSLSYGTVFSTVTTKTFDDMKIPLPPLPEQKAIARILGALDDKIELNRKMNETLEAMAQALFKSWFVDFDPVIVNAIRAGNPIPEKFRDRAEHYRENPDALSLPEDILALFPDSFVDSELGPIPEGWEVGTLGTVAENPRRNVQADEIAPETPYIGLEHMPRHRISLYQWGLAKDIGSNKFQFKNGEILFGKLRPYFHKVGVAPIDGVCSTDILVITPISEMWFAFVLGHMSSNKFIEYAVSCSTGTKMPRTNWSDMSHYPITIPSRNVAKAFNELISGLVEKIIFSIHESRTLSAIRDTLLPMLISGKIRVAVESEEMETEKERGSSGDFVSEHIEESIAPWPIRNKFMEAVLFSGIVGEMSDEDFNPDRVRITKLGYLAKRHIGMDVLDEYSKMEAGPYDPSIRYKGPEKIAIKNGYVEPVDTTHFKKGEKFSNVEKYLEKYGYKQVMEWLEQFRYVKNKELELLATVDYAVLELMKEGKEINARSVLEYLEKDEVWSKKLREKADVFNEDGIRRALRRLSELFSEEYQEVSE